MEDPHQRLVDSLESSGPGLVIDWKKPPPPKLALDINSMEEMLIQLGLMKRQENPTQLGKAELHTSFLTSDDPKMLTWYENRDPDIDSVHHYYGTDFDVTPPMLGEIVVLHPHPFTEPCWAKYRCKLVEPVALTQNNSRPGSES